MYFIKFIHEQILSRCHRKSHVVRAASRSTRSASSVWPHKQSALCRPGEGGEGGVGASRVLRAPRGPRRRPSTRTRRRRPGRARQHAEYVPQSVLVVVPQHVRRERRNRPGRRVVRDSVGLNCLPCCRGRRHAAAMATTGAAAPRRPARGPPPGGFPAPRDGLLPRERVLRRARRRGAPGNDHAQRRSRSLRRLRGRALRQTTPAFSGRHCATRWWYGCLVRVYMCVLMPPAARRTSSPVPVPDSDVPEDAVPLPHRQERPRRRGGLPVPQRLHARGGPPLQQCARLHPGVPVSSIGACLCR